ncbi:methyltransferase domain-containing protein [soil metagenome]
MKAAGLLAGERVLDVACGTGIVARTAAGRVGPGGTVAGLDVNPAMLELARELAGESIEFFEGNAQALPFNEASFDVVFCQQGLQFFGDRPAAVGEMFRVTTPRGRAICAVWRGLDQHPAIEVLDRILARYLPPEAVEGSDAPFWLDDIDEVRSLFVDSGFSAVHIRTHISEIRFASARSMVEGLTGAHAPLAGAIAELDDEVREVMYREIEEAFAGQIDDDGIMFPMTGALVVANKQPQPEGS